MRTPLMTSLLAAIGLFAGPALAEDPAASAVEAAVLQGFDMLWVNRPHRLNVLKLGVDPAGPSVWAEVKGGTWADGTLATDSTDTQVHYAALRGAGLHPVTGRASVALEGRWARRVGDRLLVVSSHVVEAPVPAGTEAAGVWLTGLHVVAGPEHPAGYTMQGLTIWAGAPSVIGETARFTVTASVVASAVPWRDQDLDAYTASVAVDWVLIPAAAASLHREEPEVQVRRHRRFLAEPDPPTIVPMAWTPPEGTAAVLAGCSGFRFFQDGRGALDGRFLRQLTVELDGERLEAGRWSAGAATRFSNAGALTRPMHTDTATAWTLLALPEGATQAGGATIRNTGRSP